MSYERIPEELKLINQWCVWKGELKENGKVSKVPYQTANGYKADINNISHFASFKSSLEIVQKGYADGLLFALTKNDEYAVIDLDDTEGNANLFEEHEKIFKAFNTYSEISPSGKGLHLFCKGSLEKGRRNDSKHIEMYSSERWITFTGNVYHDVEIAHRQELLDRLWEETGKSVPVYEINNKPQESEDDIILNHLFKAVNGEKAHALYTGNWGGIYESQSQADIALINMLAFYSKNVEQIERLFAKSALGQRPKASRKDYLGNMIKMAFDRQLPEVDIESLKGLKMLFEEQQEKLAIETASFSRGRAEQDTPGDSNDKLPLDRNDVKSNSFPLQKPPGLIGEITDYIMQQAPRPCYEIALVGAIGLLAGICGRAFNVSKTGLNYYIAILAETSCGKEQIRSGYDNIFAQITPFLPGADSFDGPGRFRSGQSLFTAFQESSCFVSIIGEFGMFCREISSPRASENTQNLKSTLLDIYTKSGFNKKLPKSVYADKLRNTKKIPAPSLTIVGESTPDEFYTILDESSVTSGFLNRFSIIEYKGNRPQLTHDSKVVTKVPDKLLTKLKDLMGMCLSYNETNEPTKVQIMPEAQDILNEIERKATLLINAKVPIKKDLWGRADLKVQKLAAIVAVGINPWNPVIDKQTMQWAYDIVCYEIENITSKYDTGSIGEESRQSYASDDNQLNELARLIGRYIKKQEISNGRITDQMFKDGVFPYSVVAQRSSQSSCFKRDKMGATAAFKRTMQNLIDAGDIEEIGIILAEKTYGKRAKLFAVKNYDRFVNDIK